MKAITTYLLILSSIITASGQKKALPTVRATTNRLTMYLGNERGNFNGINDLPNPFSYSFGTEQPATALTLVSQQDSISLMLQHGVVSDCQIIRKEKGDTVLCHFTTHKLVKAAVFTDTYKKTNEGKTIIEVPEVYELINVVFALTDYGKTGAIYKQTPYYTDVMAHFSPYKTHPAVRLADSLLAKSGDNYYNLKMDSYAYRFAGDKIQNGGIYDRVSWGEENQLAPYIPLLNQFARISGFRAFYQKHSAYYKSLIDDFQKNIDVATMKSWLEKQFPATHYSAVKVIFTPLVGHNQSANHFDDNGFSEAQAHVDFPFVNETQKKQPQAITKGQRMKIIFTELNHSYLNPEADKFAKEIDSAFSDLSKWSTPNTPSASYNNTLSCFEEYMNYALVTLLYHDLFDQETFEVLRVGVEKGMVANRGFRRFGEFDQELLRLYKGRKPGQTVADLYPSIIAWAAKF